MPTLPLSVMNVIDGMRGTQGMVVVGESAVNEASAAVDYVVSGSQVITLTIKWASRQATQVSVQSQDANLGHNSEMQSGGLRSGFVHDVERRLGSAPEAAEARRTHDFAYTRFACLCSQAESDLLRA